MLEGAALSAVLGHAVNEFFILVALILPLHMGDASDHTNSFWQVLSCSTHGTLAS